MAESKKKQQQKKTSNVLDLTISERPTVRLDQGDFELRLPEELSLTEYGRFTGVGLVIQERAAEAVDVDTGDVNEEVLEEVQVLLASVVKSIFVDLPDEVAKSITPGMFMKVARFFRGLSGVQAEEAHPLSKTAGS